MWYCRRSAEAFPWALRARGCSGSRTRGWAAACAKTGCSVRRTGSGCSPTSWARARRTQCASARSRTCTPRSTLDRIIIRYWLGTRLAQLHELELAEVDVHRRLRHVIEVDEDRLVDAKVSRLVRLLSELAEVREVRFVLVLLD